MKKRDLTNKVFNGIKGIKFDHRDNRGRAFWIFKCHCSKHFITDGYKVTSGHTKSCGCKYSIRQKNYEEKIRNKILGNIEVTKNGCWNWKGSIKNTGYAQIVAFGSPQGGHRLSYKVFRGNFDESYWVCHSCDNRKCVNPYHLFLGNAKDNYLDMVVKNRRNKAINEKCGRAKLTKEKVLEARKLYSSGLYGCSILSKKYGVTSRTIWCAIKGKTWKNLQTEEKNNG